jgi:hypothetical protein
MLEACEQLLSADAAPSLSDDFGERVMRRVEGRAALGARTGRRGVVLLAGGLAAAAMIAIAVVTWPGASATAPAPRLASALEKASVIDTRAAQRLIDARDAVALTSTIWDGLARLGVVRSSLSEEFDGLSRYALHFDLPEGVPDLDSVSPLYWLLPQPPPAAAEKPDGESDEPTVFSL